MPQNHWERFVAKLPLSEQDIRAFVDQQEIAPGIIVGMLQHGKHLPWTHLNRLKKKLDVEEC